jgi:hypothetical protein
MLMLMTVVTNPALSPPQDLDQREDTGLLESNVIAGRKGPLHALLPISHALPTLSIRG